MHSSKHTVVHKNAPVSENCYMHAFVYVFAHVYAHTRPWRRVKSVQSPQQSTNIYTPIRIHVYTHVCTQAHAHTRDSSEWRPWAPCRSAHLHTLTHSHTPTRMPMLMSVRMFVHISIHAPTCRRLVRWSSAWATTCSRNLTRHQTCAWGMCTGMRAHGHVYRRVCVPLRRHLPQPY